MGVFSESDAEDVETIRYIIETSSDFYNSKREKTSLSDIALEIRKDFEDLSAVGGKILSEFLYPTTLQRISTFLVLCNAFRYFSLSRNGRPLLNLEERKAFLATFTCILVRAALFPFTFHKEGIVYAIKWVGFPDVDFQEQFITFMAWIDSAKVTQMRGGEKKDDTKLLAHFALGCALALQNCVKFEAVDEPERPLLIPSGADSPKRG